MPLLEGQMGFRTGLNNPPWGVALTSSPSSGDGSYGNMPQPGIPGQANLYIIQRAPGRTVLLFTDGTAPQTRPGMEPFPHNLPGP
jgi:hypothetical protein